MNILFLTTVLPASKLHGSEIASQNIIDGLTQNGCSVTVVGYGRKEDGEVQTTNQEIMVAERNVETKKSGFYPLLWFAFSLTKQLPYSSGKYYTKQYIRLIETLLSKDKYDAIVIDHSQLGWLLESIGDQHKIIFNAHNIEHEIYQQHLKNSSSFLAKWVYQREAQSIKTMEDKLAIAATQVWALTEHDSDYFAGVKAGGKGKGTVKTLSLPSGFTGERGILETKEFDIGLIGSWPWKPNEEGLHWFLQEVYPHLPPNISIHVAGRGVDWLEGKYPNIVYRGFVPDAQKFMAQARVLAIPMLSGGGIQIKTLDAITAGCLIVGTPVALRGISDPPSTVQVVEDPAKFAHLLVGTANSQSQQQAIDEAQAWYKNRQQTFLAELADAIAKL